VRCVGDIRNSSKILVGKSGVKENLREDRRMLNLKVIQCGCMN
jgi:hypothetical protein